MYLTYFEFLTIWQLYSSVFSHTYGIVGGSSAVLEDSERSEDGIDTLAIDVNAIDRALMCLSLSEVLRDSTYCSVNQHYFSIHAL